MKQHSDSETNYSKALRRSNQWNERMLFVMMQINRDTAENIGLLIAIQNNIRIRSRRCGHLLQLDAILRIQNMRKIQWIRREEQEQRKKEDKWCFTEITGQDNFFPSHTLSP